MQLKKSQYIVLVKVPKCRGDSSEMVNRRQLLKSSTFFARLKKEQGAISQSDVHYSTRYKHALETLSELKAPRRIVRRKQCTSAESVTHRNENEIFTYSVLNASVNVSFHSSVF